MDDEPFTLEEKISFVLGILMLIAGMTLAVIVSLPR